MPGRFDALLALARVAPATSSIGLVATVTTTHTEPFHISKNVATLDLVSGGRAGWHVAVSTTDEAARAFGRTSPRPAAELWAEADDAIEVVSRLWDSWEDDAVIRDRDTGRYIDRDKLHYIDFEGRFFSVRGPSITPRSPQGQPLVVVDGGGRPRHGRAPPGAPTSCSSTSPTPTPPAAAATTSVAARPQPAGTPTTSPCSPSPGSASRGCGRSSTGSPPPPPVALDLVDDAAGVAATLESWSRQGAVDGFLLQPDVLPTSLDWLVDEVMPPARARRPSDAGTLRERFGLPRPPNRYATAEAAP